MQDLQRLLETNHDTVRQHENKSEQLDDAGKAGVSCES